MGKEELATSAWVPRSSRGGLRFCLLLHWSRGGIGLVTGNSTRAENCLPAPQPGPRPTPDPSAGSGAAGKAHQGSSPLRCILPVLPRGPAFYRPRRVDNVGILRGPPLGSHVIIPTGSTRPTCTPKRGLQSVSY